MNGDQEDVKSPPPYSSNGNVSQWHSQQQPDINPWSQQPILQSQWQPPQGHYLPHRQNQILPVVQHPQYVILAAPQTRSQLTPPKKRALMVCGVGNILCGIATTIVSFLILTHAGALSIASFITPTFSLVTGTLAILASSRGRRVLIVSAMVMAIMTAVICAGSFFFSCTMWGVFGSGGGRDLRAYRTKAGNTAILFAVVTLLHLCSIILCSVLSGFCCNVSRCCGGCCYDTDDDPMQGGRLAYFSHSGQQAMVAGQPIMLAGQTIMIAAQPGQQANMTIPAPVM